MASDSGQTRALAGPAPRFPVLVPEAAPQAPARGSSFGYLAIGPAIVLAVATVNPALTIACVLSLGLIIRLLWRPGQPPALLMLCGLQWLQASMMTFDADARGVELWTMTMSRSVDTVTYLTLLWVTAVAIGAWFVTRKLDAGTVAPTEGSVPIHMDRLLIVYAVATVFIQVAATVASSSLLQVIQAFAGARWCLVFAIFAYGWRFPGWRPVVILVLCVELGVSFLSFFSTFKLPLYLFAIALATSGYRPTMRAWFGLATIFALTLYMGVVWSAIKKDYRDKLSGGRGHRTQVVVIGVEERVEAFVELVGTVDAALLSEGLDRLVGRIGYVEYFGYVADYVPAVRDHERGAIWGRALIHVLAPRALFPDKPPLPDDTEVTERYTGLNVGAGSGTSISIGIAAETYVDFGRSGVFVIGLLCGAMYGLGYRYFIKQRKYLVLAQGMAVAMCMPFGSVEMAAAKMLGGYLSLFIVAGLLWQFALPRFMPWLQGAALSKSL